MSIFSLRVRRPGAGRALWRRALLAGALAGLLSAAGTCPTWAQSSPAKPAAPTDELLLRNGDDVVGRVEEVTPTLVRYRRADQPAGPLFEVPRDSVFRIRYANGTFDVFEPPPRAPAALPRAPRRWPTPDPGRMLSTRRAPYLAPVMVPDSIALDSLHQTYFEAGRFAGATAFRSGVRRVAPPPPVTLPTDPPNTLRASAAYEFGYRRQYDRARADRADIVGGIGGTLGILLLFISILSSAGG